MQVDNREQAKLDLELWMQEDGTRIFGSVLYSADIFDEATAQRVARHVLVSLALCLRSVQTYPMVLCNTSNRSVRVPAALQPLVNMTATGHDGRNGGCAGSAGQHCCQP